LLGRCCVQAGPPVPTMRKPVARRVGGTFFIKWALRSRSCRKRGTGSASSLGRTWPRALRCKRSFPRWTHCAEYWGHRSAPPACIARRLSAEVPTRLDDRFPVSGFPFPVFHSLDPAIDVLACPQCGGRLRFLATIADRAVIEKILGHLDLPVDVPRAAPARSTEWLPGVD
jgi:hypothetical protein